MKVAIVGKYPMNPETVSGGVANIVYNLVEGLRKIRGLTIHVVTCSEGLARPRTVIRNSVTVHYLPGQRRFENITFGIPDQRRIRRKIEEIKPDIIHSQDQDKYTYAALRTHYATVVTIFTIAADSSRFNSGPIDLLVRRRSNMLLENLCLKKAREIIVISPRVKDALSGRTAAAFHYVPTSVHGDLFALEDKEQKNYILFAGRVRPLKGIHVLLEALAVVKKEMPDIRLTIAGRIEDQRYYERLKSFVTAQGLDENVRFSGVLSRTELLAEYEMCALFVLPSFSETFGMVTAEAMAAGKPVIASRLDSIASYLNDGTTGFLVKPGDANELAAQIKRLLSDRDLRKRVGEKAREEVKTKCSAMVIAQQNYDIYKSVYAKYTGKAGTL